MVKPRTRFTWSVRSIPGFGFYAKPTTTSWGVDRIASAWATLMARLGYTRYGAQGGDWGSTITASLGSLDPQHCAGIHVTLAMNSRPNVTGEPTPEEARALAGIEFYREWDSGYATQQSTRPQTVAYGLTDSPAGQAAWILEKFWAWTDCNGHPENILSRDELLDLEWSCGRIRRCPNRTDSDFGRERGANGMAEDGVGSLDF